jgi:hypothetical protein
MTSGATARINEERVLEQQKVSENTVGHLHVDSQTTRFKGKSLNMFVYTYLYIYICLFMIISCIYHHNSLYIMTNLSHGVGTSPVLWLAALPAEAPLSAVPRRRLR